MLALVLGGSPAAADPPPCLVSGTVPARAFVGEQIVRQIRILRRPDVSSANWIAGPAFPGFRADPLPGLSSETRVHEQGAVYLVFQERVALFPVRAGTLAFWPRLRYGLRTLPGDRRTLPSSITLAATVVAVTPPVAGRPAAWSGLVGEVRVGMTAEPRTLTLGQSLHAEVSIEGEADVRDAPSPFDGAREIGGAEIFAARPKLVVDPGERLALRRSFSLELVPRSAGLLTLPPVRIPFFDPRSGRYGVAASAPVEIRVDPPAGS